MEIASNACVTEIPRGGASSAPAYLQPSSSAPRADTNRSDWLQLAVQGGGNFREPCEPHRLWLSLCSGKLRITELIESEGQAVALLEQSLDAEAPPRAIPERRLEALRRRLAGDSEKTIGFDLGISGSTACSDIRRALEAMSHDPRIPGLMMFLARVYHLVRSEAHVDATFTQVPLGELRFFLVTLPRLELDLSRHLSPAEVEVCQLFLGGRSHDEIARLRGTRPRTVSNQIASIFHKFNVSGRITLMTALIRE